MLKKKALIASVLCAVASVGFVAGVSAEETMSGKLDEVVVEASRDILPGGYSSTRGSVGLLGNKDVMDVPFTQVNLTEKTIEVFGDGSQPLDSILANNPGVRQGGTILQNDFTIRGIRTGDGSANGSSIYLNGIPGLMSQFTAPTYAIERIEMTSGPNSGISGTGPAYETTAAGGIINFVSKKATKDPITRYKQTFSGKGHFGEYLDIGRRFGRDNEWGVRINTELQNGETAINGAKVVAQGITANINHIGKNSKTNFLTAYRHLDVKGGQRWFSLGSGVTKMLDVPDASNDLSFDGQRKESRGYIFALNHEQNINKDWKVFLNVGHNNNDLDKNITGNGSRFTIIDNFGNIAGNFTSGTVGGFMTTKNHTKNTYGQIGITGNVKTGEVEHTITLAADKAHQRRMYRTHKVREFGGGNIYESGSLHLTTGIPSISETTGANQDYWGISLADDIKYKKLGVLVGVHKHNSRSSQFNGTAGVFDPTITKPGYYGNDDEAHATCPTYAVTYRPDENVSLYASHSENFDKGQAVTQPNGEIEVLSPSKIKQNEIGVKYENKGLLASIAYFDVKAANNIQDAQNWYHQDGEVEYEGVELSIAGKLTDKWNIMGGLLYVDGTQNKTAKGASDGKRVDGLAKWSGVATLQYNADDNFSAFGRAIWVDSADIKGGKFTNPSHTTLDLGVDYKTKIMDVPTKFSLVCYNVTDKDYWITRSGGSDLFLCNPRTVMLSATFDI